MAPRPRQVSDDEILEVAAACFLESGPSVSTQIIADRLNISQAALFKRFNTKRELMLRALLPPERTFLMGWLDSGPTDEPLRHQLAALVEMLWKVVSYVVPRMSVLNASGIEHSVIKSRYRKFPLLSILTSLAGWIHRAQEEGRLSRCGSPMALAQAWLGTLQGRALLRFLLNDIMSFQLENVSYRDTEDDNAYIATVTEFIWRAVGVETI